MIDVQCTGFACWFCGLRACALIMGAKQTKEDETPTSPKSPRVAPVAAAAYYARYSVAASAANAAGSNDGSVVAWRAPPLAQPR